MRWVKRVGLLLLAILALVLLWRQLVPAASAPAPVGSALAEMPTLVVHDTAELLGRVRDSEVAGEPVRVRVTPESSGADVQPEFSCRGLTAGEKAQALRMVGTVRKTTDKLFEMNSIGSVEEEEQLANLLRTRAMCDAVILGIEAGEGFFAKDGLPAALKSNGDWHYWNMRMRTKDEGGQLLWVPIDLQKHPDVRQYRDRALAVREFVRSENARKWNTLSHEVRRSLLDAAKASRAAFDQLESERASLPSEETSAARRAEIGRLMHDHRQVMAKVPPEVHPVTLDWGPR